MPVRVAGSRGPLSHAQSEAILARLKRDGARNGSAILDHHLAVEEAVAGSPLTAGNQVKLLADGPATFDAMFEAIRAARDHINMETYIIEDDEIGHKFADALIHKQRQGVQVNLIYDSVGAIGTKREFFTRLTDTGIAVLEFNPVNPLSARKGWEVNQRDHRKLLVVDGHTAFLGGINVSGVYSGGSMSRAARSAGGGDPVDAKGLPWRDTHMMIRGPAVAEFQKLFLETWDKQHGPPLAARTYFPPLKPQGNAVVRALPGSPDDPVAQVYITLLSAINSAERSVLITMAYFVPDPQLLDALTGAAGRGVDVRLILPSTTDFWLVLHAGRAHYTRLLKGGVRIFQRKDALLHAKTAVIDGVWSTVGSTNLDWRSFLHNDELNAVILGAEFGEQLESMFERDLQSSQEVTLEQWRRRPLSDRMKEMTARLWEYWL